MKRWWLWMILALAVLGFVAGLMTARVRRNVQEIKATRNEPPPRTVPSNWPEVRLTPGHAVHVIDQAVPCDTCHDPNEPTFSAPDTGVCTACHEEQARLAHVDLQGRPMDCYTCHVFSDDPESFGRWHCTRCHGPFENEDLPPLAMHNTVPCENCHDPHKPISETAMDCDECHKKIDVQHGRARLSGGCVDCHGGHRLASQAASCMSCHATHEPTVSATATFAGGHDSCTTCHKPHTFSAQSARSCTSCHQETRVLAQNKARAHRDCASCHQPHDVRAAAKASCAGCHSDVSVKHRAVPAGAECVSCHEPHPKGEAPIAQRCTSCHHEAHSETAFHSPKTECIDCHQPHDFDLTGLAQGVLCVRCHASKIRQTSRLPGHSKCQTCHQGTIHELAAPLACTSCHEEQFERSPEGHRECNSCHEPHRAQAAIAQVRCADCHKPASLPGLHRIPDDPLNPGHGECNACHSVHAPEARADRATCMSCHEDVANHEPDAKRCTGCHTFIGDR